MALRSFRRIFSLEAAFFRRGIMTSSWNSAKAEEELESNPYFDKYADKIKKLREANKEEYLAKLKAREEAKNASKPAAPKVSAPTLGASYPAPRKAGEFRRRQLKDIMNLELLADKSPEEISAIWKKYYSNKEDVIFGSLSKTEFEGFINNCRKYPVFVVPLPRGDGFEFFMVQFNDDEFHLTPLILYQKYKEDSPEALCVSYFAELTQNVVLVLGEYDKKVLSPVEAQCLVNTLQLFYHNENRLKLVITFNESPQSFDHNELLREINSLSLEKQ